MPDTNAHGFVPHSVQDLPGLGIQAQRFEHACGLVHLHLACEDRELAFSIAFPTRPDNDTGAAHALEHLVLCGSQRYPVRDPFFNMLRRSLATYANAQTGPDHTRYPFSTIDEQDYWNLMGVYLDAVFRPALDRRDFDQEAVRLVIEDDKARFDGVVFNEMQGARADPMSMLAMQLAGAIVPDTPYARDFGGDPVRIPELDHAQLRDFHQQHYQPGRALVVTYGHIAPERIQAHLAPYLEGAAISTKIAAVGDGRGSWPARVVRPWPQEAGQTDRHLWARLWELPNATMGQRLWSGAMAGLLCEEGQPLACALDELGFGRRLALGTTSFGGTLALAVLVGDLDADQLDAVEQCVTRALEQAQRIPMDPDRIERVRQALEMAQRSTAREGGQGLGLQLMSDIVQRWAWSGLADTDAVDLDKALAETSDALNPGGFERFGQLLSTTRSTVFVGQPDPDFFQRRARALHTSAGDRLAQMDTQTKTDHAERMAAMTERQHQAQDEACLPILDLDSIDPTPPPSANIEWSMGGAGRAARARIQVPLRGLADVSLAFDLSGLSREQAPWLRLATELWPRMPVGQRDWRQSEQWRSLLPGTPGVQVTQGSTVQQPDRATIELGFSATALERLAGDMREGLVEAALETHYDAAERVRFLVDQSLAARWRHMGQRGAQLAQRKALAWIGPVRALSETMDGTGYLDLLQRARNQLDSGQGQQVVETLDAIMDWARAQPAVARTCSRAEFTDEPWDALALGRFAQGWTQPKRRNTDVFPATQPPAQVALIGPTDLAFVHMALAGPAIGSSDEAALGVACELLKSHFLHGALRERGGAYGGGVRCGDGAILFYSFDDPRLTGTLADFERARQWLDDARVTPAMMHEAILARMGQLGRPEAPMETAFRTWERQMAGVDERMRQELRARTLDTSIDQVREVARRWMAPDRPSSRVVFAGEALRGQAIAAGLECQILSAPAEPTRKPRRR